MGNARFIALEGCDGTGKTTQVSIVTARLAELGYDVRMLKFPDYESPSSGPVKLYLSGKLSDSPEGVSAYAASALFAVDRYCSFKRDWEKDYAEGKIIITDRYVTSNIIFQASKLPPEQRSAYIEWNKDFEYNRMGIPVPDAVIYLDLPLEVSEEMVQRRAVNGKSVDIHEKDREYQKTVHRVGLELAESEGWRVVNCAPDGRRLSLDELSDVLTQIIREAIG